MPEFAVSKRTNWQPNPERAVLLIHDMQLFFLNRYDTSREPIPTLLRNVRRLRDQADAANLPIVYSAQPAEQSPQERALLNDFWGGGLSEPQFWPQQPIIAELAPRPSDTVLTKWRYSAFQRSPLRAMMHSSQRDQLIICGIYAHIGCLATALEAFMQDIQVFLAYDGVADFSPQDHCMAVEYVSRCCGLGMSTAELITALSL